MVAHLAQIGRCESEGQRHRRKLDDAKCLALADEADQRIARGDDVGALHGLPLAVQGPEAAVGFPSRAALRSSRTTCRPKTRWSSNGCETQASIAIGKTNVPEFGMGSHTYNKVYGTTVNPYDPTKSAGGSSGGAGAALAAGMLPLANGSDLGGSLRNPGTSTTSSAFRPTVGLVPPLQRAAVCSASRVKGPMARSVADTAFLLSVMAGSDARDPGCYPSDPAVFRRRSVAASRACASPGAWISEGLPLDRRVRSVLDAQRTTFESLGCIVEDACPDLSGADEDLSHDSPWRSWNVLGPLLEGYRDQMKPEAISEIEAGANLSAADIGKAMMQHAELLERMRRFQEKYEFMVCAVNQVPPFDATIDWPKEIEGATMEHYIAWMKSAYWITATFRPAISVPAGFSPEGLPVGIQIVGRYRDDLGVLQIAHAFEQVTGFGRKRPALA